MLTVPVVEVKSFSKVLGRSIDNDSRYVSLVSGVVKYPKIGLSKVCSILGIMSIGTFFVLSENGYLGCHVGNKV